MEQFIWRYRSIEPRDLEQIKAIHLRLFPVQYSDEFFERAVRGVGLYGLPLMTSIAYYIKPKKREPIPSFMKDFSPAAGAFRQEVDLTRYTQELAPGATSMAVQGRLVHSLPNDDVDDGDDDEEEVLVGFIFSQLLGSDRCADDVGDAIDLSSGSTASSNHADYFGCYILTLGVLPEYRRGGLGQTLVHQAIQSATNATAKCALVYLHVIHFNKPALRFYGERVGFMQIKYIENFYLIDSVNHGAYVYGYYINGYGPTTSFKVYRAISSAARHLSSWWDYLISPILSLGVSVSRSSSHVSPIESPGSVSSSTPAPAGCNSSGSCGSSSGRGSSRRPVVWEEYMDERMERERRLKMGGDNHNYVIGGALNSASCDDNNGSIDLNDTASARYGDIIV